MGLSSWTNWSRELKYPLEQESQVWASHYVMQLRTLPLSFWWEKWWIFNNFMQNGTVPSGSFGKNPITFYSIARRCFLCKADYCHVKKLIYFEFFLKGLLKLLIAPEEGEREKGKGPHCNFSAAFRKKKKLWGSGVFAFRLLLLCHWNVT